MFRKWQQQHSISHCFLRHVRLFHLPCYHILKPSSSTFLEPLSCLFTVEAFCLVFHSIVRVLFPALHFFLAVLRALSLLQLLQQSVSCHPQYSFRKARGKEQCYYCYFFAGKLVISSLHNLGLFEVGSLHTSMRVVFCTMWILFILTL